MKRWIKLVERNGAVLFIADNEHEILKGSMDENIQHFESFGYNVDADIPHIEGFKADRVVMMYLVK